MYIPFKTVAGRGKKALYNIIGVNIDDKKDVHGFWLSEEESSRHWLQILEEVKQRGVEDILFIYLDGLTGLEKTTKGTFPKVITQRYIVDLMRNSTRYIPRKSCSEFSKDLKAVNRSVSLDEVISLL